MKKLLLASVATSALSIAGAVSGALTIVDTAGAADLRMPLKAPTPLAPAFSWSGCYVGAHWGWGWGKKRGQGFTTTAHTLTSSGSFDNRVSGPVFGGQVGCNYQWPSTNFVVGIEGSYSAADINGQGRDFYSNTSYEGIDRNKIDGLASVTGRIGWNGFDPSVLFYFKGGWAWAHERDHILESGTYNYYSTHSHSGWTIGGGIEWAFSFAPRWSGFVEVDYYDFRHRNIVLNAPTDYTSNVHPTITTAKIGVNYKLFSPF